MNNKTIKICGIISALSVIGVSFLGGAETQNWQDYLFILLFALLAYIPFAILDFVAKKHFEHMNFFVTVSFVMLMFDLYAKYDAFFVSDSSTAGLTMVAVPVFLIGAVLIVWVCYVVFVKLFNK